MVTPSRLPCPLSVELTLTHQCNHRCIHCFHPNIVDILTDSDNDWKNRCDIVLRKLNSAKVCDVVLSGGEPFQKKEVLQYLCSELSKLGMKFSINTNGTLIDDLFATFLSELPVIPSLFISLPSVDPQNCEEITCCAGSYRGILHGLDICEKHGLDIGVNIVYSKRTRIDFDSVVGFLHNHPGIKRLSITPVCPPDHDAGTDFLLEQRDYQFIYDLCMRLKDSTDVSIGSAMPIPLCLLENAHDIRQNSSLCTAGRSSCVIDFETGKISACAHFKESYGNIYSDSLESAWEKMGDWSGTELLSPECRICSLFPKCGGECRVLSKSHKKYHLNGTITPLCVQPISHSPDAVYQVNEDIDFRDEGDIIVATENDGHRHMLNRGMLDLLIQLDDLETFTYQNYSEISSDNPESEPIFQQLLNSNLIKEVLNCPNRKSTFTTE